MPYTSCSKGCKSADASGNVYEKDSVNFPGQDNKRNGIYEGDDCQFRINFKNETSADHGDLTNLYSAAKVIDDGYVVEDVLHCLYPANGSNGHGGPDQRCNRAARIATLIYLILLVLLTGYKQVQ